MHAGEEENERKKRRKRTEMRQVGEAQFARP
jgi:hypothetical protein